MEEMLELSDQKFKVTVTNALRSVIEKVDSLQEQVGNVNREMEMLRIIKINSKTTLTEMRNAFEGLISRLDMGKKRISELEETSIVTS